MILKTLDELAEKIIGLKNVTILTHARPDGDTVGAGLGLCYFLRSRGVKANVKNSDGFPQKFGYLYKDYEDQDFEEQSVVSVDVADTKLLGDGLISYAEKVDLCIDHHYSNKLFARDSYVDSDSCAVCLIIYRLIRKLGAVPDPLTADCLYTGISTDTGCFMYENASPEAHRAAADLVEYGARAAMINREMFQIKSRGRILSEQKIIGGMRFEDAGRISLIAVTNDIIESYGIDRDDLDGYAAIPLTVEGVEIGITLKQLAEPEDTYKISVRTVEADASAIAAAFGGGGHKRAAGCSLSGSLEEVSAKMIKEAEKFL